MFDHVMIDIETLGIEADAPIVSIGAAQFNPDTGEIGEVFYRKVLWASGQEGRAIAPSNIEWWLGQDKAAQKELIDPHGAVKLGLALHQLEDFIPKGAQIWANGPMFDCVILEHAYKHHSGRMPPWGFRNTRCCRTLKELASPFVDFSQFKMVGTMHNALDDCIFQIKWTCAAWQTLRNPDKIRVTQNDH